MMTNNFDDVITQQVAQFNEQIEESASRYRHLLELLCAERMMGDLQMPHESAHPPRVRTEPSKAITLARSMLRQADRAGRWIVRRVSASNDLRKKGTQDGPMIIEGEYIVITNPSNTVKQSNNKEDL